MDVKRYLERIHYNGSLDPTPDTLAGLQKAHLCNVPYENLDLYYGCETTLALEEIYDKIVNRNRGGYCFELNGLFAWLLRELGFQTEEYFGRWLLGEALPVPARRHRVIRVKFPEGDWLADVGVGCCTPLSPLKIETGLIQEREGRRYQILDDPVLVHVVQTETDNGFENMFSFDDAPQQNIDFLYVHYFCAHYPNSVFRNNLMVHRMAEKGRYRIMSALDPQTGLMTPCFSGLDGVPHFLHGLWELQDTLAEYFGIHELPEDR